MQIVIDISEEAYNKTLEERVALIVMPSTVREGTVLPKGHGNLYDENDIDVAFRPYVSFSDLCDAEDNMPIIISADSHVV